MRKKFKIKRKASIMSTKICNLIEELEAEVSRISGWVSALKGTLKEEPKHLSLVIPKVVNAARTTAKRESNPFEEPKKRVYTKRSEFWSKPHPRKKRA